MKYKSFLIFLLLILFALLPLRDFLIPGLPITHDGQDHVARIANFYKSLEEGNVIPRWAANLNWGYGHPILMFLYPFSSYLGSFFHLLGFSLVDSVKLVFVTGFIVSGIAMFLFLKDLLEDALASFIGALLYLYAPYRFVDMYVRGAIGEHMAFVFVPLTFYAVTKIYKEKTILPVLIGALAIAGFLLSHNAIALMFFPLLLLYCGYYFFLEKDKIQFTCRIACTFLLGFSLAGFFWIPAFFEGKYTLRDIVTANEYASRFVEFKDFMYGAWNYGGSGLFTVQIGIAHWLAVFLSLPLLVITLNQNKKYSLIFLLSFIVFFFSLFLMTAQSASIWKVVTILQKFQFPWRFLSVTVFLTSLLSALVLVYSTGKKKIFIAGLFILTALITTKDYWKANGYLLKPESYYTRVYKGTTDTGESAPIWSIRFMEKEPRAHMEFITGEGKIKEMEYRTEKHVYKIMTSSQSRIKENTLYFPGWKVLVDGKPVDVQFQDPLHRGLMTFYVGKGEHTISILFTETKLRTVANLISIFGSFVVLFLFVKYYLCRRYQ